MSSAETDPNSQAPSESEPSSGPRLTKSQLANRRKRIARKKEVTERSLLNEPSPRHERHLQSRSRHLTRKACRQYRSGLTAAAEATKALDSIDSADFSSSSDHKRFKESHPARQASRDLFDSSIQTASHALNLRKASKSTASPDISAFPSPAEALDYIHKRVFQQ